MQRKITRFARAAKCGNFGASGACAAAEARCAARPANASQPKPQASCERTARRVSKGVIWPQEFDCMGVIVETQAMVHPLQPPVACAHGGVAKADIFDTPKGSRSEEDSGWHASGKEETEQNHS
jgi:hypothetical protein